MPSTSWTGRELFDLALEELVRLCRHARSEEVRLEAAQSLIQIADETEDPPAPLLAD